MDRKWSLAIISLAFLFISSCSAVSRIQQVTEGNNGSDILETNLGVTSVLRDERPASKIVTVTGFSLIKGGNDPYESSDFEAAGYKWRLLLYVNGNSNDGGSGYISLYVRILETGSLPQGWQVNVDLKLFVYNAKQFKYLTVTDGIVKTFNDEKKELGYGQLIPLSTFKNANEGYLVQDTASFGAEIFVWTPTKVQEKVRIISNPPDNVFTYKTLHFSTLEYNKMHLSEEFLVADRYWVIGLGKNPKQISVWLYARSFKKDAIATSTYVDVIWQIKNQKTSKHIQKSFSRLYPSYINTYGVGAILELSEIDGNKGYLENDSIILEFQLTTISVSDIASA